MNKRYLIVNADDFGLTPSVNKGILEAHQIGIVTSTTVLSNFEVAEHFVKKAKSLKRLGVGVHLNITNGKALSPAGKISSLVDQNGQFLKYSFESLFQVDLKQLEMEWTAQIKRFKRVWGKMPTHLDSHHHVHAHPHIWKVFQKFVTQFKLPFRLKKIKPTVDLKKISKENSFFLANCLIGSLDPKAYWRVAGLKQVITSLRAGVSEIVCHPGYFSKRLSQLSSFNKNRENELRVFSSKQISNLVKKENIQMINFNYLRQGLACL